MKTESTIKNSKDPITERPTYEELEQRVLELEKYKKDNEQLKIALSDSEIQKKAILDGSLDSIRLVDKEMRIIWANKIIESQLGKDRKQIIGNYCYSAYTGRNKPCPNCPTEKSLKSGKTEFSIICEKNVKGIEGISYWHDYAVPIKNKGGEITNFIQFSRDVTELKNVETELLEEKKRLEMALSEVKMLSGLLPICASCKKIRDDKGYWNQIESYIQKHSDAEFSHGMCPDCTDKLYGNQNWYIDMQKKKGRD